MDSLKISTSVLHRFISSKELSVELIFSLRKQLKEHFKLSTNITNHLEDGKRLVRQEFDSNDLYTDRHYEQISNMLYMDILLERIHAVFQILLKMIKSHHSTPTTIPLVNKTTYEINHKTLFLIVKCFVKLMEESERFLFVTKHLISAYLIDVEIMEYLCLVSNDLTTAIHCLQDETCFEIKGTTIEIIKKIYQSKFTLHTGEIKLHGKITDTLSKYDVTNLTFQSIINLPSIDHRNVFVFSSIYQFLINGHEIIADCTKYYGRLFRFSMERKMKNKIQLSQEIYLNIFLTYRPTTGLLYLNMIRAVASTVLLCSKKTYVLKTLLILREKLQFVDFYISKHGIDPSELATIQLNSHCAFRSALFRTVAELSELIAEFTFWYVTTHIQEKEVSDENNETSMKQKQPYETENNNTRDEMDEMILSHRTVLGEKLHLNKNCNTIISTLCSSGKREELYLQFIYEYFGDALFFSTLEITTYSQSLLNQDEFNDTLTLARSTRSILRLNPFSLNAVTTTNDMYTIQLQYKQENIKQNDEVLDTNSTITSDMNSTIISDMKSNDMNSTITSDMKSKDMNSTIKSDMKSKDMNSNYPFKSEDALFSFSYCVIVREKFWKMMIQASIPFLFDARFSDLLKLIEYCYAVTDELHIFRHRLVQYFNFEAVSNTLHQLFYLLTYAIANATIVPSKLCFVLKSIHKRTQQSIVSTFKEIQAETLNATANEVVRETNLELTKMINENTIVDEFGMFDYKGIRYGTFTTLGSQLCATYIIAIHILKKYYFNHENEFTNEEQLHILCIKEISQKCSHDILLLLRFVWLQKKKVSNRQMDKSEIDNNELNKNEFNKNEIDKSNHSEIVGEFVSKYQPLVLYQHIYIVASHYEYLKQYAIAKEIITNTLMPFYLDTLIDCQQSSESMIYDCKELCMNYNYFLKCFHVNVSLSNIYLSVMTTFSQDKETFSKTDSNLIQTTQKKNKCVCFHHCINAIHHILYKEQRKRNHFKAANEFSEGSFLRITPELCFLNIEFTKKQEELIAFLQTVYFCGNCESTVYEHFRNWKKDFEMILIQIKQLLIDSDVMILNDKQHDVLYMEVFYEIYTFLEKNSPFLQLGPAEFIRKCQFQNMLKFYICEIEQRIYILDIFDKIQKEREECILKRSERNKLKRCKKFQREQRKKHEKQMEQQVQSMIEKRSQKIIEQFFCDVVYSYICLKNRAIETICFFSKQYVQRFLRKRKEAQLLIYSFLCKVVQQQKMIPIDMNKKIECEYDYENENKCENENENQQKNQHENECKYEYENEHKFENDSHHKIESFTMVSNKIKTMRRRKKNTHNKFLKLSKIPNKMKINKTQNATQSLQNLLKYEADCSNYPIKSMNEMNHSTQEYNKWQQEYEQEQFDHEINLETSDESKGYDENKKNENCEKKENDEQYVVDKGNNADFTRYESNETNYETHDESKRCDENKIDENDVTQQIQQFQQAQLLQQAHFQQAHFQQVQLQQVQLQQVQLQQVQNQQIQSFFHTQLYQQLLQHQPLLQHTSFISNFKMNKFIRSLIKGGDPIEYCYEFHKLETKCHLINHELYVHNLHKIDIGQSFLHEFVSKFRLVTNNTVHILSSVTGSTMAMTMGKQSNVNLIMWIDFSNLSTLLCYLNNTINLLYNNHWIHSHNDYCFDNSGKQFYMEFLLYNTTKINFTFTWDAITYNQCIETNYALTRNLRYYRRNASNAPCFLECAIRIVKSLIQEKVNIQCSLDSIAFMMIYIYDKVQNSDGTLSTIALTHFILYFLHEMIKMSKTNTEFTVKYLFDENKCCTVKALDCTKLSSKSNGNQYNEGVNDNKKHENFKCTDFVNNCVLIVNPLSTVKHKHTSQYLSSYPVLSPEQWLQLYNEILSW